jgi:hypothetical protein
MRLSAGVLGEGETLRLGEGVWCGDRECRVGVDEGSGPLPVPLPAAG